MSKIAQNSMKKWPFIAGWRWPKFFAPNGQSRIWQRCFREKIIFCLKWFKRVQMGPKGYRWVQKGPKGSKTLRLIILVPFGPIWITLER